MLKIICHFASEIPPHVKKQIQSLAFVRDRQVTIPDALRNDWETVLSVLFDEERLPLDRPPRFATQWTPHDDTESVTGVVLLPHESVRLANDVSQIDPAGPQSHSRKLLRNVSVCARDRLEGDFRSAEGELICTKRLFDLLECSAHAIRTAPVVYQGKQKQWLRLMAEATTEHLDARSINPERTCLACGDSHWPETGLWLSTTTKDYQDSPAFDALRFGHKQSNQALVTSLETCLEIMEEIPTKHISFEPIFSPDSRPATIVQRIDRYVAESSLPRSKTAGPRAEPTSHG